MSITVQDLYSGYSDIDILHGITLRAREKRITCIIGPNGCGKTTLMRTIYGFIKPRKGKVYYKDEEITGLEPHNMLKKGISFVPQLRSIFPYLSVYENLKMAAWTFRKDKRRVEESIDKIYDLFPILRTRKNVKAHSLSGGEQKMLEVSRALIPDPKVILVDEPTAGLAPKVAYETYKILERAKKEHELTVLMVDQNIRQAITFSDYLYVMELGQKKDEGAREKFEAQMRSLIRSWI